MSKIQNDDRVLKKRFDFVSHVIFLFLMIVYFPFMSLISKMVNYPRILIKQNRKCSTWLFGVETARWASWAAVRGGELTLGDVQHTDVYNGADIWRLIWSAGRGAAPPVGSKSGQGAVGSQSTIFYRWGDPGEQRIPANEQKYQKGKQHLHKTVPLVVWVLWEVYTFEQE